MYYHTLNQNEAVENLKSNLKDGLSDAQAKERLEQYGENRLKEKKQKSLIARFFAQFADFMVVILLIAAIISFATAIINGDGDFVDPIVILVIVILNAIMGVIQESKAQHALEALKKMSAPFANVIRNGKRKRIPVEELVPGDIMLLETGDLICADARLITSNDMKTQESALTGESLPVSKNANIVLNENCAPADRKNMVLSGTQVMSGHGTAIVTSTGMDTQIGHIAGLLNSEKAPQTPLQIRLAKIGRILGIASVVICGIIFLIGVLNKSSVMDSFMLSVSLAVAAIPEGLPAIVTIVLSAGVQRMAKSNAVVKNLPAVETLGGATVICSDKTGTLTQNVMTVTDIFLPGGEVRLQSSEAKELLTLASLCCNCTVEGKGKSKKVSGTPTESAIVNAAENSGISFAQLQKDNPRLCEVPFDSSRKLMSVCYSFGFSAFKSVTKGAPDVLLSRCAKMRVGNSVMALTDTKKREILNQNSDMAKKALRVIAVAFKDAQIKSSSDENELVFCGLIGMSDPPRKEAANAVKKCKTAGIVPIMITGDHIVTACAIAEKLGITNSDSLSMTGTQLDSISDNELAEKISKCRVFARVTPEHKVRIVKAFRSKNETVAMTGDGVNDAPALKAADIGCAMGRSGTEVAKGAADMILTDDNFATIVKAVEQGRNIYDNIKKAIHFLLSCNMGEILVIFAATLMGIPSPLLPIQLLWVNLVTDSLPAVALGLEKGDTDIMKRPPAKREKSFFSDGVGFDIATEGFMIGALTLLAFVLGCHVVGRSLDIARTMAFSTLSLSEIVHTFNMRSEKPLFHIGFFSNKRLTLSALICTALQVAVVSIPTFSSIFNTAPLSFPCWATVILLSLAPLIVIEGAKLAETMLFSSKKSKTGFVKKN